MGRPGATTPMWLKVILVLAAVAAIYLAVKG